MGAWTYIEPRFRTMVLWVGACARILVMSMGLLCKRVGICACLCWGKCLPRPTSFPARFYYKSKELQVDMHPARGVQFIVLQTYLHYR